MLGFSFGEILILALLALIVIGPKQLPDMARTLGRLFNEIRRSTNGFLDEFKQADLDHEYKKHIRPPLANKTENAEPKKDTNGNA